MVPGTSLSTGVLHRQRRFGLDYFLGGVVTAGLPYQNSGTLSSGAAYDSQVARWIARYKRYGHAVEGGVRTLYYDAECCHIQGECEWTACDDIVACWVHSVVWPGLCFFGLSRLASSRAGREPSGGVTPRLARHRPRGSLARSARPPHCPNPGSLAPCRRQRGAQCHWPVRGERARRRGAAGVTRWVPIRSKPVVVVLLAIAHRRACE